MLPAALPHTYTETSNSIRILQGGEKIKYFLGEECLVTLQGTTVGCMDSRKWESPLLSFIGLSVLLVRNYLIVERTTAV